MADTAEDNKQELIFPKIPNLKTSLKSVDPKIYKQVLIFVGIAVVIASIAYIYLVVTQNISVREQTKIIEPQVRVEDKKSQEIKKKSSQDQTRKNDLYTINSGLKSYFVTNKKVTESLVGLVPETLPELPKDPQTKEDYIYNPSEDLTSWRVSAILSDKRVFEVSGP